MDAEAQDLKCEECPFDPWQQWREYIDQCDEKHQVDNSSLTQGENYEIERLYWRARQLEN